ncbi:centrosomal protein of 164 kDa-like isoform X1 [Hypomesus transpacificus]|uniref:centrosomal protein of 164 kDa-like isoform X1 n=1 Tax=Hypomesus transpacificus TaxID=137520 RepID=UPI001F07DEDD|nr:centrosomal protein of 164 kDa-like isoform X1 [Hypomesus transpacificus]
MKEDRDQLESKVELLQERLSRRVSDVEKSEVKRPPPRASSVLRQEEEEERAPAPSSDHRQKSLRLQDLQDPPLSPLPVSSDSSLDDLRQYISNEGMSIHKARQFLDRENGRLSKRQSALQAAQSSCPQDPSTQEMFRNLQQVREASEVENLMLTIQRGNVLLRTKEEKLQQLENSVVEEPLSEELARMSADRKVTFDVSDSDLSSADGHTGTGTHPTVPAKVQQLAESLQHISGQLNTVLGALGSLAQRQAPYAPLPLPLLRVTPTPTPLSFSQPLASPSLSLSGPSWAWGPHTSTLHMPSTTPTAGPPLRGADGLLSSRWTKLFPGVAVEPMASSTLRTSSGYSGYTPHSEQARSLASSQRSVEVDGQRLQGLIDGNKKWLETRRKDPTVPLLTRYRTPATMSGLVQLGLDDNNQIKVYHY